MYTISIYTFDFRFRRVLITKDMNTCRLHIFHEGPTPEESRSNMADGSISGPEAGRSAEHRRMVFIGRPMAAAETP